MSGTNDRFQRDVTVGGRLFRATVAWVGPESGYGLLYFFPSDEAEGGRADRRALVTPDTDLSTLDESGLVALYDSGRPLTETERRFVAADGRRWLAQNIGPVWADRTAADGGSGILFTSLEDDAESLRAFGGHVGDLSAEELSAALRGALERRSAEDLSEEDRRERLRKKAAEHDASA